MSMLYLLDMIIVVFWGTALAAVWNIWLCWVLQGQERGRRSSSKHTIKSESFAWQAVLKNQFKPKSSCLRRDLKNMTLSSYRKHVRIVLAFKLISKGNLPDRGKNRLCPSCFYTETVQVGLNGQDKYLIVRHFRCFLTLQWLRIPQLCELSAVSACFANQWCPHLRS